VVPPAPKPPPKPAANKREEAEERRAFAKSEQAAGVIPSKPAVEEKKVLRVAGAASVTQGRQEQTQNTNEVDVFTRLKQYDPPSWLSISGESGGEIALFSDKFMGIARSNRSFPAILFYEEMNVKQSSSFMGIRNPNGVVDVNITNGDLTLNFGNRSVFGNIFNGTLGMTTKQPTNDPIFYSEETIVHDWDWNWGFSTNSIVTAHTEVSVDTEKSTPEFHVERRETIEGEIKTVKTGNILLAAGVAVATIAIVGSVLGGVSIGELILAGAGKTIIEIGKLPVFGGVTP
ncbi:MAG: hypothetical protein C4557_08905, partial [Anaerolineaceae bacterium]